MAEIPAESRSVNRCVYTPIQPERNGAGAGAAAVRAKQPFQRLAILQTVIETPQIAELVVERLRDDGVTDPPEQQLIAALERAWKGDLPGAAGLVAGVETAHLRAFVTRALDVQDRMVNEAVRDLDGAITRLGSDVEAATAPPSLPTRSPAGRPGGLTAPAGGEAGRAEPTPSFGELVTSLRDSVLSALRAELPSSLLGLRPLGAAVPSPEAGGGETVTEIEEVEDSDGGAAGPIIADLDEDVAPRFAPVAAVRHEDVHALLLKERPSTARFLSLSKYFARQAPIRLAALGEIGRLITYTALQRLAVDRKRDVLQGLEMLGAIEPVGFLHLERLRFTPADYVRGDLVYSLPMLPGEIVRLTHREWSRTESEYLKLVATSLETATQDSLSEKSELTESTTTQQQHTSALNTGVTASGGFGPMQITSSVGYNASDSVSRSASQSLSHAQEITKQASTRAKEEHKISFRVTTVQEVEEQSFRELKNESSEAVRWDFHRLMKKWRIDLYRYDVRMTYDIVVPEPGSYLLLRHLRLRRLEKLIDREFELSGAEDADWNGDPSGITRGNWRDIARTFNVALDPPPPPVMPTSAQEELTYSSRTHGTGFIEISLPEGYRFSHDPAHWRAVGSRLTKTYLRNNQVERRVVLAALLPDRGANLRRIVGGGAFRGNTFAWRYHYTWALLEEPTQGDVLSIAIYTQGVPTPETWRAWQMQCYQRVIDAAKARFETRRQQLIAKRDRLREELARDDGLALRQIEREEIMKSVLRWVLGRKLEFYPEALPDLAADPSRDLPYYDGDGLVRGRYLEDDDAEGVYAEAITRHGEIIRFLQHAIEWENVNYVLYPYFWTDRPRWFVKQTLFHADVQHRSFLRAGAARVVLTIRPGFEKAFLSFMETGRLDGLDASAPYFKLSDELRALAQTNYPHTPSANEENPANHVGTWFEFTPTGALDVKRGTAVDA